MASTTSTLHNVACVKVPLPTDSEGNWLHITKNILTQEECDKLIESYDSFLEPQAVSFTSRSRYIFQDEWLATRLWARLQPLYGSTMFTEEDGYSWHAFGVNQHFRFCKYAVGDGFSPHVDGNKLLDLNIQSMVTVNLYLNTTLDGANGATRILQPSTRNVQADIDAASSTPLKRREYDILYAVRPSAGTAAVFPAAGPLHDGETLTAGVKYLLRTDILFHRRPEFALDTTVLHATTEEQKSETARLLGMKALQLASRLEDGGSDKAWQWYSRAFKLCPELERT